MRIEPLLKPENVRILDHCGSLEALLDRLADCAAAADARLDREGVAAALKDREGTNPTSTPEGVAFPHALMPGVGETTLIICVVRGGVSFGVKRHPRADVVFCMVGDESRPYEHVRLLARLARIALGDGALERFRSSKDEGTLYQSLIEEDRLHG